MIVSLVLIFVLISLDQYSKYLVETHWQEGFDLIPGLIGIQYSQNTGIAFSLFENYPIILTILNSITIVAFLVYFVRNHQESVLGNLPAILIIAGGMGNILDRYTKSYVVDFINPLFVDFAIFNLADVFLNIGIFLLIFNTVFRINNERN